MGIQFDNTLVVAITSSALFDMRESHHIYQSQGLDAYQQYQIEREDDVLPKGEAFDFVRKLLRINELLSGEPRVEVILLSRNSADTGLRVFNSIQHYGLNISRAAFSGGASPWRYVASFNADLFLSTETEDVRIALEQGVAAAALLPSGFDKQQKDDLLRIAFDGDAVIFSDEAEQVFKSDGLAAFASSEKASAKTALSGGPFKAFLQSLQSLQSEFDRDNCPIRTALVTARSAPAHERVIRTLREWGIRIDESLFLGGLKKAEFLKAFGADVFFDDQKGHCDLASQYVASGHVPHGIANKQAEK